MGRILGPRGLTAKQLEQETGCKIMVRGKGSMRDKKKVRYNQNTVTSSILGRAEQRQTELGTSERGTACFNYSRRQ